MSKRTRLSEVQVGAFVLSALLILIAGSLWLAGRTFRSGGVRYEVRTTDSGGLKPGDQVRFAGVVVGRIKSVALRPDGERPVTMSILLREDVPVKADSTARIGTEGVLGTSYLVIERGSAGAPRLDPGGTITAAPPAGLDTALARVESLAADASELLRETTEVIERFSAEIEPLIARAGELLSETNVRNVDRILGRLDATVAEAGPKVTASLTELEQLAATLRETSQAAPELIDRLDRIARDLETALGPDGERLSALVESAQRALDSAGSTLEGLGADGGELAGTLRDLRDTAAHLKEFARTIEERPFSLVRIRPVPERRPGEGAHR